MYMRMCYLSRGSSQRGSWGSSYSDTPDSMGEPLEERRDGLTSITPECMDELESTDTCTKKLTPYSPLTVTASHEVNAWVCVFFVCVYSQICISPFPKESNYNCTVVIFFLGEITVIIYTKSLLKKKDLKMCVGISCTIARYIKSHILTFIPQFF